MRALDRVARWIIDRRVYVQIGIAALSVGGLLAMDELRFELTPKALVADIGDDEEHVRALEEAFGPEERRLLVVLTADDVLGKAALAYQHTIAHWLDGRRWTTAVEAITTTPIPHRLTPTPSHSLDEIEADPSLLDVELPTGPVAEALESVARTAPERFPDGLSSIVGTWGDRPLTVAPLVAAPGLDAAGSDRVKEVVDRGGLFARSLIAVDRRSALVSATLTAESDLAAEQSARSLAAHLEAGAPPPEGIVARVGGLPYVRARLIEALEDDWGLLIALACLGSIAMLAMGFRSVAGVVLPMAAVGITLAIVTGTMAHLDIPIDLLTNVIPPLLITIGLGDGVHLLTRYREERRDGEAPLPAARRTLSAMAVACFMTSITTAVGFGSLVISDTPILRRFGALAGGSVMVAYLVTVLFLPSALPAFPGERAVTRSHAKHRILDVAVEKLSAASMRRPALALGLWTLVFAACLVGALSVRVDGALLDQFEGSSDVTRTTRIVERHLGGVRSFSVGARATETALLSPEVLTSLDELAAHLRAEPGVLRVTTPGDVLRETWVDVTGDPDSGPEALSTLARTRALAELARATATERHPSPLDHFIAPNGELARAEVRLEDLGVRHMNGLFDRLQARLSDVDAIEAFVAGEAHHASRGLSRIVDDLSSSLAIAILIIFSIIGLLFRSVRLALISIPPNVLPLGAVLAWMGYREIPLHAATVIVFGICIGLAVDGTIHILSRYREERATKPEREAIDIAIRGSGRAVVLSSAALLLGFVALQVSGFVPIRRFGELSVVAVSAALVAELTLLPALLILFRSRRETTR